MLSFSMAAWLDLVSDSTGWSLVDTGRLEKIVQGMNRPESQFPFFIYFAGNGNRMKALRALFPRNNVTRKGPAGLVRLHISTTTACTENPMIFAESNLGSHTGFGDTDILKRPTSNSRRWLINDNLPHRPEDLQHEVIRKLMFPWTQVFCVFVGSVAEIKALKALLQQPKERITVGGQLVPETMRVVIVLTANGSSLIKSINELVAEMADADTLPPNLTTLDLSDRGQMTPSVAFEPLRNLILNETQSILNEKRNTHVSFSAVHVKALWYENLRMLIEAPTPSELDYLVAARANYPENPGMITCYSDFLATMAKSSLSGHAICMFLASALLMNAYPPKMHLFNPNIVFNTLYRRLIEQALIDTSSELSWESVLAHFVKAFALLNPRKSSFEVRRDSIGSFYRQWGGLRSVTTCLSCMCQPPEHMMPCGHSMCDTCVVLFGTPGSSAEYHTNLTICPFCGEQFQLTIRRLPPTKGPVILSLDGGGARGIIQLGLLRALERRLGPIQIKDIPDLCTGSSVGALLEMDIILNETSAEDGWTKFPAFAQEIFQSSTCRQRSTMLRCFNLINWTFSILRDRKYNSSILEHNLKAILGHQRRIFDVATSNPAGCRVAIITSRSSDGKACVLANYRGRGRRNADAAYQFLIPRNEDQNPFLWEAAQCTVAAPFFFPTKPLSGLGIFQDGGVRANNPMAIALKEAEIIWPSSRKHDMLISVGTGSSANPEPDQTSHRSWRDSALPRMIRATLSSPCMDGEQGFREALNYVPNHSKPDIFRVNHEMSKGLPQLDDTGKLDDMSKLNFTVSDDLVRTVLVTGFFYFELDESPIQTHGSFLCRGSIFCSRSRAKDILNQILNEIPDGQFQTSRGHRLGSLKDDNGCHTCGYYRKIVSFSVNSLEEEVSLGIANDQFFHKIGGCPMSMYGMLEAQQAFAYFGRSDHLEVSWPPSRFCYCSRKTKRRVRFVEPTLQQKKRRL